MIFVFTLGFEEKYVLRSLTTKGVTKNDEIWIIIPKPRSDRTDTALSFIKMSLRKLFDKNVNVFEVPIDDFYLSVKELRDLLDGLLQKGEIMLNISGGMKILALALLAAALTLNKEFKITILREDMGKIYELPSIVFRPISLDNIDIKILRKLSKAGLISASKLARELKYSRTTVWRRLERLIVEGLVEKVNGKYKITGLGISRI
ncbi:MAG: CRISPR locus-related DNA-binding protein [Thermoproteales archaeon]|nr:CRISPR locus-related DNA-binding protein [Thermoproteales archaeon]